MQMKSKDCNEWTPTQFHDVALCYYVQEKSLRINSSIPHPWNTNIPKRNLNELFSGACSDGSLKAVLREDGPTKFLHTHSRLPYSQRSCKVWVYLWSGTKNFKIELDIHVFRYLLYLDSHPEEYLKYLGKWISVEYSYWLIALQRGKGDIKRNVLNLGVVICAERCRRCRDQEDERSRASSICGRTVLATQTGLIRRGVSNDGPAVPSHICRCYTKPRIEEWNTWRIHPEIPLYILLNSQPRLFPFLLWWLRFEGGR